MAAEEAAHLLRSEAVSMRNYETALCIFKAKRLKKLVATRL
ncbi:hypothetical protein [Mesorhizobium sp. SARCC-RB16n]|nr:hypothetical protein [Mesorhizobium sp. SARCC-RB16n]